MPAPIVQLSLLLSLAVAMHNEFDTYNADACQRVRKGWNTLSDDEKSLAIRGLIKLREQTKENSQSHNDEYEVIMAEHSTPTAKSDHQHSNWFFWHAYLIWEVESRVRNLGGEFACYALPYWDYTMESMPILRGENDDPLIFDGEFLGGYGDPDDQYTVNGYSWDVPTAQWWVPITCGARDDEFPICSLKRKVSMEDMATIPGPIDSGRALREMSNFEDFTRWFIQDEIEGSPGAVPQSLTFMSLAYDPIWVFFHSFIQLQQFLWTDCHEYDQIKPEELDAHPEAYTAFCSEAGENCERQELDDPFHYSLHSLEDAPWSFIHSQALTVRKAYHAPRWNIRYDLGDGEGFWKNGVLEEWCADKLNAEWFTLSRGEQDVEEEEEEEEKEALSVPKALRRRSGSWAIRSDATYMYALVAVLVMMAMAVSVVQACKLSKQEKLDRGPSYGTVVATLA